MKYYPALQRHDNQKNKIQNYNSSYLIVFYLLVSTILLHGQTQIEVYKKHISYFKAVNNEIIPDSINNLFFLNYPKLEDTISPGYNNDPQKIGASYYTYNKLNNLLIQFAFVSQHLVETQNGYLDNKVWYRVSIDNGKSFSVLKPIIQSGEEFNLNHPIKPVYIGKNGFYLSNPGIVGTDRNFYIPFYFPPLNDKGKFLNPYKSYGYSYAGILKGKPDYSSRNIQWNVSIIAPDTNVSSCGFDESTIAELDRPGYFLCIFRASNNKYSNTIKGYKYYAISDDYCKTWSVPKPLIYSNGSNFFSPASPSMLVKSTITNNLYWIGNITDQNPDGDYPRFPLIIAQVDKKNYGIIKNTITVIDDYNPAEDSKKVQLTNFLVRNIPGSDDIIIRLRRIDWELAKETIKFPICMYWLRFH